MKNVLNNIKIFGQLGIMLSAIVVSTVADQVKVCFDGLKSIGIK